VPLYEIYVFQCTLVVEALGVPGVRYLTELLYSVCVLQYAKRFCLTS